MTRQEARPVADVPEHLLEVLTRFTRAVRESPAVDARSGVSARFAIAAAETVAASALRRAALLGELSAEDTAVPRVWDVGTATLRGKVEFETDGEGRDIEILDRLLRRSIAETWRSRLGGPDLSGFLDVVEDGRGVTTGISGTASGVAAPPHGLLRSTSGRRWMLSVRRSWTAGA